MKRRPKRATRSTRTPTAPRSPTEVAADVIVGRTLAEIAQLAGVTAGPAAERIAELRTTVDRVELELIASLYQRAINGDVEAAKFLLITKFGYSATGPTQPIKVDAKVVIKTDKAPQ